MTTPDMETTMQDGGTKAFDPLDLGSLTTGVLLREGGFAGMHEAAEYLLGYSVWTHEFASEALWKKLKAAALAQFPDLPTEANAETFKAVAADIRARYGETVQVCRGQGNRDASPLETLREMKPDADVVVVEART